MSEGQFELKGFEHVEAIPGRALLRVAAASGVDLTAASLIVDGGDPIAALPAPPGPPGLARVAFSIPADLASDTARYELALPDGERVPLPDPERREGSRIAPAGAGLTGPAPAPAAPVDAPGADVIAELQRRLEAERVQRRGADVAAATSAAARAATETRLKSLGAELADARADLEATRDDLASARDELKAAQGQVELGQTRANHARAEAEAAESTLIQRAAEITLLRQTLAHRDHQAQHTYLQWEQITAELTAEIEVTRQAAANFQAHARHLQLELADSRLELSSLRALGEAQQQAVLSAEDGEAGDPAAVVAKLNAAAAALEQARSRASEAEDQLAAREAELDRLRSQLPAA